MTNRTGEATALALVSSCHPYSWLAQLAWSHTTWTQPMHEVESAPSSIHATCRFVHGEYVPVKLVSGLVTRCSPMFSLATAARRASCSRLAPSSISAVATADARCKRSLASASASFTLRV